MKINFNKNKGFSVVEIIIAVTILLIIFMSFTQLAQYNLLIQQRLSRTSEAIYLASEAIEAVRSIKNESWSLISSLTPGTNYYPVVAGGKWTLSNVNPGNINTFFNQRVIFERVYRDANDNISSMGTEDPEARKLTAYIQWTDRSQVRQVNLVTYVTNWSN